MKTGTSRASARRKSVRMTSRSGSGCQSGSPDSTSVAPSRFPRTALISAAAAGGITEEAKASGLVSIDSRTTPMRRPRRVPGSPDPRACTANAGRTEDRGTVVYGSRGS